MGLFSSSKKKGSPEEQAYRAAANSNLKDVHKLIKSGLNANNVVQRDKGWTMLHVAADHGDAALVRALFELQSTINASPRDKDNVTPLHLASSQGDVACVTALLQNGAAINTATKREGWTPLHSAVLLGRPATVLALVNAGADVNTQSQDGLTALHLAAGWGHNECVEILLQHHVNMEVKTYPTDETPAGETAVERALKRDQAESMRLLVEAGCNIDSIVERLFGVTPPCTPTKPSQRVQIAPPVHPAGFQPKILTEAHRMVAKYPNRVPVMLLKSELCLLPNTKQKKFLTPNHFTVGDFVTKVLKPNAGIDPSITVFLTTDTVTLPLDMPLKVAYAQFQDDAGYLNLAYHATAAHTMTMPPPVQTYIRHRSDDPLTQLARDVELFA